jgi:isopenicillin N synthase-like dioxygenase
MSSVELRTGSPASDTASNLPSHGTEGDDSGSLPSSGVERARAGNLPVLDLGRLISSGREREEFLGELRETAHQYGFFYVTGHGIPHTEVQYLFYLARRFFGLSEAEKLSIDQLHSPHFRGYTRVGFERTRGRPDWREQFDIAAERPALNDPSLPPWNRLEGPNQWPPSLPELKPFLLGYQNQVTALAIRILEALSESLGQDKRAFETIYTPAPSQRLKVIRYPERGGTDDDQGCGPHKDSGFLTVLLQDAVGGLQVELDGRWIDAPPIPGTFVINIGEILELATSGYFRADVHQVVTPKASDRLSVAFFFGANLDATVPLLNLPPEYAAKAHGLTEDPLNPLFRQVGQNYLKGRLRSHPDVARAHYADLLTPEELSGELAATSGY